jgi:cholesterol oxidase
MADADFIIIGSGFGGSVTACRLAEAGASVLVLERGREWNPTNFPRKPGDAWVWDDLNPAGNHGWWDIRMFPHMTVAQGAGVGGGSLVYANISVEAKPETFASGWPAEITADSMAPLYAEVGRMMEIKPVPQTQWPERTKLLKEAATAAGWEDRFRPLGTAVRYDNAWTYEQPDPHNHAKSRTEKNIHGVEQGTCVHLGECDLGCPVRARNTLDFNYLAVARKKGAKVLPLHIVRTIREVAGGYELTVNEISGSTLKPKTFTAKRVIVACGSLGSTELLLRSKQSDGLPNVSSQLGVGWSSNGDFLTPALHMMRDVWPSKGPTITAAIDLLDGKFMGQQIFIEDGGLPPLAPAAVDTSPNPNQSEFLQRVNATLRPVLSSIDIVRHVMPWFAQSRDAADGTFSLRNDHLFLDWKIAASEPVLSAVVAAHQKLAGLTAGIPITPLPWLLGRDLVTPHPLGGCRMGVSAATGVVNGNGQVFGHPGLYVADGAIVPKAIGLNPSRTIAALAEHIAAGIVKTL